MKILSTPPVLKQRQEQVQQQVAASANQWADLFCAGGHDGPPPGYDCASTISEQTHMSKRAVLERLQTLAKRGYLDVIQCRDPRDNRIKPFYKRIAKTQKTHEKTTTNRK